MEQLTNQIELLQHQNIMLSNQIIALSTSIDKISNSAKLGSISIGIAVGIATLLTIAASLLVAFSIHKLIQTSKEKNKIEKWLSKKVEVHISSIKKDSSTFQENLLNQINNIIFEKKDINTKKEELYTIEENNDDKK